MGWRAFDATRLEHYLTVAEKTGMPVGVFTGAAPPGWPFLADTIALMHIHPDVYARGPVILVNQATKRVAELYKDLGYSVSYRNAPRRISCTGDRTPAREVIATRNL